MRFILQVEPYNEAVLLGIIEFTALYIDSIKGPEAYIPDKLFELTGE